MEAFLKNTPPRTVLLLLVSISLLVLAALGSYVVWPNYREYRQSLNTLQLLEGVVARGDSMAGEMAVIDRKVKDLNHKLHGDMVNLPQNQMESFIIGRLQSVSWRNHVELLSVIPESGSTVYTFQEVLFNVRVSGDYFDLYKWLLDVQEELGYVVVKQFNLTPGAESAQGNRLGATFSIVAYRGAADA